MSGWRPEIPGVEIEEVVGRGGFAVVYRGVQANLNRTVAVKVLNPSIQADPDAMKRFQRECQAIGSLTGHHAVITVYEAGTSSGGDPYLVMEYLEGGSLHDQLKHNGPMAWEEVAELGAQVAEALAAAHDLGTLHRDVKPANVMRDRFGRHKLGDFGIAGLAAGATTTAGAGAATVAFAAPEVLLGQRATERADAYGLGATLYALLTGGPAHAAATDESLVPMVMRVTNDPLPPIAASLAPVALRTLVADLMAKEPDDRPADLAAVAVRLRSAAPDLDELHTVPRSSLQPSPARSVSMPAPAPSATPTPGSTIKEPGPVLASEEPLHGARMVRSPLRRLLAGCIDGLILAAVLSALLLATQYESPRSTRTDIRIEGDGYVGVSPTRLQALAGPVLITATNDRDEAFRLALIGSDGSLYPPNGAVVQPGSTRTFGAGELLPDTYDIADVAPGGSIASTVSADDGVLIEALPDQPAGPLRWVLIGVLAAVAIQIFGWPALLLFAGQLAFVGGSPLAAVCLVLVGTLIEFGARVWMRGTPGERVGGLLAEGRDGGSPHPRSLALRWLAKPLSVLPLWAGYWVPSLSQAPSWHDRLGRVRFSISRQTGDRGRGAEGHPRSPA